MGTVRALRYDGPAEGSSLDFGHYDGHYTPGNANLIRMGYIGIRNRAKEKLIGESDPSKRDFLEALADETTDPQRRVELMQMAEVCYQIASGPPDSFHAGLQMMWFTFMYGARGSIGRFDQWMYPLYKRDVESS